MLGFERAHTGLAAGSEVSYVSFSDVRLSVLEQHAFVRTGKLVIEASRKGVCFELGSGPAGSNLMPTLSAGFDVFIREVFFSTSV